MSSYLSKKTIKRKKLTNVRNFISLILLKNNIIIKLKNEANKNTVQIKQINDLVFNEKVHLVAQFKDYLTLEDNSEFIKRFYNKIESIERLKKIFDFYEENSKIFPNYIILSESRYIYKNIQKKQKLIDQLQEIENIEKEKNNLQNYKEYKNKVINTDDVNSIMNQTQSAAMCNTKNNSFNSVELLIDHIERADFYKNNKNYMTISKKVDVIVMNKCQEKNFIGDSTSSQNAKKNEIINKLKENYLNNQDANSKDKLFMKQLILNPNKVKCSFKSNLNLKNINKNENKILKLDSLKTIDLEIKINSHRDINKSNISQGNLVDKFFKENNDIFNSEYKANRRNVPSAHSNHKSKDDSAKNKVFQENTTKKLFNHHSTLSIPKLSSNNFNILINNILLKEDDTALEKSPIIMKNEIDKNANKSNFVEKPKTSNRNIKKYLNSELSNNKNNINKNIGQNSSNIKAKFQSTFNIASQNIFSRNDRNQLKIFSPDFVSRQTIDNFSNRKLMNDEKLIAVEGNSIQDKIKILIYNQKSIVKNSNQHFLTFLKNNKINENKSKYVNNFHENNKNDVKKNQLDYRPNYKIYRSSKSPFLNTEKLNFIYQNKDVQSDRKISNKNYPLFESSKIYSNPNSARINYK